MVLNARDRHTCFPAHVIKVQEYTVYSRTLQRFDPVYEAGCLVAQVGKIIGQVNGKQARSMFLKDILEMLKERDPS